jgi:predicted amidohydrolase
MPPHHSPVCLAAAQTIAIPGDLSGNIQRHCDFVRAAAAAGSDLLLFPELSLTGYEPDLVAGCVVDPAGATLAPLRALAQEHGLVLVIGAPLASDNERPHIGAIVLFADGSHATYHKRHLHAGPAPVPPTQPAFPSLGNASPWPSAPTPATPSMPQRQPQPALRCTWPAH